MMNVIQMIENKSGMESRDIMRRLGISKSYYSMLRSGERTISKNLAIRIYQEFHISLEDTLLRPEVHENKTDCITPVTKAAQGGEKDD